MDASQECIGSVEYAEVVLGGNHGCTVAVHLHTANEIAIRAKSVERQAQGRNQRQRRRRADDDGAVAVDGRSVRWGRPKQAGKTAHEFILRRIERRAMASRGERSGFPRERRSRRFGERPVAQPEIIAVFRAGRLRGANRNGCQHPS